MSYFLLWSIPCYYTTRFIPTAQFIQQTEGRREHCQLQEKRQACLQLRALKRSDDSEENQDACLVLHRRPSRENAWVPTDPSTYGMTVLHSRMLFQPVLVTLGNLSIKWTLKFLEIASCFVIRAEVHRPSRQIKIWKCIPNAAWMQKKRTKPHNCLLTWEHQCQQNNSLLTPNSSMHRDQDAKAYLSCVRLH